MKKIGAKVEIKHNSRFAKTGEPDLYGCFRGRMFVLEVKLPDGEPTKLQIKRLKEWYKVGAATGVVRSKEDAERVVRRSYHNFQHAKGYRYGY